MACRQVLIQLPERPYGLHLITNEIRRAVPLDGCAAGLLNLWLQHTSAALLITENADPAVRHDLQRFLEDWAPRDRKYQHRDEGADDMPAHLCSAFLGCGLSIPVCRGDLALGTWQGIYLAEHREAGGPRRILATLLY